MKFDTSGEKKNATVQTSCSLHFVRLAPDALAVMSSRIHSLPLHTYCLRVRFIFLSLFSFLLVVVVALPL